MKHRRIVSALLGMTMALSAGAGCLTANSTTVDDTLYGDVNGDGELSVADLVMFGRWMLGNGDLNAPERADMNADGRVNMFDFILMRRKVAETFPEAIRFRLTDLCAGIEGRKVEGLEADSELVLAQTGFGVELMKKLYSTDKNEMISPYSIISAFGMTANGARGETLEQIEQTLGGIPVEKLNKYLYTLRKNQPNDENCKFITANSIWARNDPKRIKVNKDFLQTDMDYYDAEFYLAPFDQTTVTAINNWVNRNTDGMIPEILEVLEDDELMHLINAVTFDAKWEVAYETGDTIKGYQFTSADGTRQKTDMMSSTEYAYLSDDNAQGILKYYEGGKYAFAAILPNEEMTLGEYVDQLTSESLNALLKTVSIQPVMTFLPKFKSEYSVKLEEILPEMGMQLAFDEHNADFSGINDAGVPMYIGSVLHKTFIEVDEDGTKAAAVTDIGMKECTAVMLPEKQLHFDRPFMYCIIDTETALPVFMGVMNSVE